METQTVTIQIANESAVLESLSRDGWNLVSKSNFKDGESYVGTFQREPNRNRTQLNG